MSTAFKIAEGLKVSEFMIISPPNVGAVSLNVFYNELPKSEFEIFSKTKSRDINHYRFAVVFYFWLYEEIIPDKRVHIMLETI